MSTRFPDSLIPTTETARLRALHLYQIANTAPEKIFDHYVAWAAQLFSTPIALISFVDEEYVWFKAVTGAEGVTVLPRSESMCSAAILPEQTIITADYSAEGCQLIKPDVAQALGLNFYAGSALNMPPDNARIGMMAVIGREYRTLSSAEENVLEQLAALVSHTIELRFQYLNTDRTTEWEAAQRELSATLDDNATLVRYLTARNNGLNLDDPEIYDLVLRRVAGVNKVLDRRLDGATVIE